LNDHAEKVQGFTSTGEYRSYYAQIKYDIIQNINKLSCHGTQKRTFEMHLHAAVTDNHLLLDIYIND
jgi:hypothetical protein